MALFACASPARAHGDPTAERASTAYAVACAAGRPYEPPYPQQLYAAKVIAVVEARVDCGNGDHRLALRAVSGDFHGPFVGRTISGKSADGGPWPAGDDAQSRAAIDAAKVGDRVEVEMGMYPGLNQDGTLAHPGALESIRAIEVLPGAPPPR